MSQTVGCKVRFNSIAPYVWCVIAGRVIPGMKAIRKKIYIKFRDNILHIIISYMKTKIYIIKNISIILYSRIL